MEAHLRARRCSLDWAICNLKRGDLKAAAARALLGLPTPSSSRLSSRWAAATAVAGAGAGTGAGVGGGAGHRRWWLRRRRWWLRRRRCAGPAPIKAPSWYTKTILIGFDISQQYLDFALKVQTPKKTPQKKVPSTYTGSDLPIKIKDGVTLKVLELFSGTGSVGKIAEKIRGCQVVSVDVEPETAGYKPTVVCDVLKLDYKNLGFIPDVIWASPPCRTYSIMASGTHRTKADMAPKTPAGKLGKKILEKTVEIISYFDDLNPNLKFYMENPHTGLMKHEQTVLAKLPPVKMAVVSYCKYGFRYKKDTDVFGGNGGTSPIPFIQSGVLKANVIDNSHLQDNCVGTV
eukprot:SAG22_NODE_41_length_25488_cov_6.133719_1_plen_344_part_10